MPGARISSATSRRRARRAAHDESRPARAAGRVCSPISAAPMRASRSSGRVRHRPISGSSPTTASRPWPRRPRPISRTSALPTRPRVAAFAVASPVIGDRIDMTNRAWSFSIAALRKALGPRRAARHQRHRGGGAGAAGARSPPTASRSAEAARCRPRRSAFWRPAPGSARAALLQPDGTAVAARLRGRPCHHAGGRRRRGRGAGLAAPRSRPCLGRARAVGPGPDQPAPRARGARRRHARARR